MLCRPRATRVPLLFAGDLDKWKNHEAHDPKKNLHCSQGTVERKTVAMADSAEASDRQRRDGDAVAKSSGAPEPSRSWKMQGRHTLRDPGRSAAIQIS